VIDRLSVLVHCFLQGGFLVAKRKPECSVEKTIAGIAQAIHEVREEGESTDRLVGVLSKGVAALTVRVEELERESSRQSMEIFNLRVPPRTWLGFLRGE
jgi:hypothetical protein